MLWLREQLEEESDRKFILASHVYAGTRYKDFSLFNELPNEDYFQILKEHKDRIVIELAGHDHFASLRAHTEENGDGFHNIFVAPSITPWYSNNPGVTSFEIVGEDSTPKNLRSTFLNLEPTIGKDSYTPQDELEFRELDFEAHFGVKDLSADSILDLARRLSEDEDFHLDYLVRKLGYYPSIPDEVQKSIDILTLKEIIIKTSNDSLSTWP